MGITKILLEHFEKYPLMQPQDCVKLLFQSSYGGGHIIESPASSLDYLKEEISQTANNFQQNLFEDIGDNFCRINLKAIPKKDYYIKAVNRIFVASSLNINCEDSDFTERLEELFKLSEQGKTNFSNNDCKNYIDNYLKNGIRPIHHSEIYKKEYQPSYRVICKKYSVFFSLIVEIERLIQEKQKIVIGIDGNCGSGKSTLAELLSTLFECNIIPMDNFFLPLELRTVNRFNEIGGNIHYERFEDEVSKPLKKKESFNYRKFDCSKMDYTEQINITPKELTICEGTYSCHPRNGELYDLKVAAKCDEPEQIRRILKRSGSELLKRFVEEWIPLENKYFENCSVYNNCDFVFDTGNEKVLKYKNFNFI